MLKRLQTYRLNGHNVTVQVQKRGVFEVNNSFGVELALSRKMCVQIVYVAKFVVGKNF